MRCVLKLVHQHCGNALVVLAQRGVVAQQFEGAQQQLGKSPGGAFAAVLVFA